MTITLKKEQPLLNTRELQILGYLASGLRIREIAAQMSLSHYTIEDYEKSLRRKSNTHNRVQMINALKEHLP
jgi:DNA-binding NarL/FixJ family response regulator